jgi:ABC-2 type transport system permease protein
MDIFRTGIATPFQYVYLFVLLFVLLGAIHDERRDRSVLFWKSMPVSDLESIASKIILAVWIAPVITIAAIVLAQIFMLIIGSGIAVSQDLGEVSRLWWQSGLFKGTAQLFVGYFIQGFWALPIYGWLLLVSATVNKTPILWAVLVPCVPVILERMLFGTSILFTGIGDHLLFAALPSYAGDGASRILPELPSLAEQFGLFLTTDLWAGVIIGAGLLIATVYCRKRFNDI